MEGYWPVLGLPSYPKPLPRPPLATTWSPSEPTTKSALLSSCVRLQLGPGASRRGKEVRASPITHSAPLHPMESGRVAHTNHCSPCSRPNISTVLTKCGRE